MRLARGKESKILFEFVAPPNERLVNSPNATPAPLSKHRAVVHVSTGTVA